MSVERHTRHQLWRRHTEQGDRRAREQLVLEYAPLVSRVAARLAGRLPPHVGEDDLVACGHVGLISAIERFDPARGVEFERFAASRVHGAMIDGLRSLDWVPRSLRRVQREIGAIRADLQRRLHRPPTDAEAAAALGLPVAELQAAVADIRTASIVPLDERWTAWGADESAPGSDAVHPQGADPAHELDAREARDQLADALASLPETERLVIALCYYENLTLSEVGEVVGTTVARAGRLRTRGLERLRSAFMGDRVAHPARS